MLIYRCYSGSSSYYDPGSGVVGGAGGCRSAGGLGGEVLLLHPGRPGARDDALTDIDVHIICISVNVMHTYIYLILNSLYIYVLLYIITHMHICIYMR